MTERRKNVTERRRNIAVGVTALAGLVGLATLLTAFGYTPPFLRGGYSVTLYLDNAADLREDSRVTLSGLDIGRVESIAINDDADQPGRVRATLFIREEVGIPENVAIRIETPLFGGGPVVALLEPDSVPRGPALAMDGSARLADATIVDPLVQLEVVSTDFGQLTETMVEVGDNLNRLLVDQGPDQPSLPRVVQNMEQRLNQLDQVLAGVDQWVNDPSLREDVTQSAQNIRELTERLAQTVETLEARFVNLTDAAEQTLKDANGLIENGQTMVASIERSYIALADDASATMVLIDRLLEQASSDESALGLLLNDPDLYHNLNDSAERLGLMIDDARLLIEKWQAEGVPLRLFK
ncbi:MAG: MlaD family protein [Planctomycetota bacterium]